MSPFKLLLSFLVFTLASVTLCFGSAKTLYDHTYPKLAAYPVPNVWLEDDPTNSYVAAMVYTGDGQRPNNYFRDVSVLVTSIGKDGGVDGGDWADVAYWKVFIFDLGDRKEMHNHFSLRALAAGGTNVMVRIMRRPTNSVWKSPTGYHPTTGQPIYYFTFSVWLERWKAIAGHVYAMGAVPVFKGRRKDMPFLPLIWTSYGMDHTNSTYVGSGTNHGLYAAPEVPGEDMPLNVDGDPVALFLYNHFLPWGHGAPFFMGAAVDQDNPPLGNAPFDMGTRLASWSPTNLVLETVITTNNYTATTSGHLGFAVESTPDLARPHWLDVASPGLGSDGAYPIGSTYQFSVPISPTNTQRFYRIRNCDYGTRWKEPGAVVGGYGSTWQAPTPTNFAIPTPARPTNILYSRYTGPSTPPGLAVPALQAPPIQPTLPLPQALASVRYSPEEASAALAKTSAQSTFVAPAAPAADAGEVAFDHDGRVVLWRSKAAPAATGKASPKSSPRTNCGPATRSGSMLRMLRPSGSFRSLAACLVGQTRSAGSAPKSPNATAWG